jgi:phosphatidylinositol-4,5-bisphosphate 3-kinase catalytic subunit alpha/beta/delta
MMISTGLPELSSEKDLNYLRETLVSSKVSSVFGSSHDTLYSFSQVLDLEENEAIKHFRSKFEEALQNSWKTSLNWASHNFSKNNNK